MGKVMIRSTEKTREMLRDWRKSTDCKSLDVTIRRIIYRLERAELEILGLNRENLYWLNTFNVLADLVEKWNLDSELSKDQVIGKLSRYLLKSLRNENDEAKRL